MKIPAKWITHPLSKPINGKDTTGKRPITPEWPKLTKSIQVRGQENTGLVCGKISDVVAIDFDNLSFFNHVMNDTKTLMDSRTEGRCHVYFTYNNLAAGKFHEIGIEVLTDGNNCVIPPSIHHTGSQYKFNDCDIIAMPDDVRKRLLDLFQLYKELNSFKLRTCLKNYKNKWNTFPWQGSHDRVLMLYAELKAAGAELRHAQLVSRLIFGNEYDDKLTATEWKNADATKTWKKETVKEKGLFDCDNCKGCNLDKVRKGQYYDIAMKILSEHHIVTFRDTDEMMIYRNGIYVKYGDKYIDTEIIKILTYKYTTHLVREVLAEIRSLTLMDRAEFDKYPHEVNLKNGIYDVLRHEFKPHDPTHLAISQLPIEYDPLATCPTVDKFFREVLEEKDIPAMYEFFGFCLYREYFLKKFLILQGEGNNGKSVVLELLGSFLGRDNFSSVNIQSLSEDKFASANLFGKLANIGDDIPSTGIKDTGMLKQLTGDSTISAQFKFQNSFKFVNYAKLIFAANNVPTVWDDSVAFYSRVRIMKLLNTFSEEKGNVDVWLGKKLLLELPGLFNEAMKGLDKLLKNNKFSNESNLVDSKNDFKRISNSVYAFAMDMLAEGCGEVEKQGLLSQYHIYCKKNNRLQMSDDKFFKTIPKIFNVETIQHTIIDSKYYSFNGIKYKISPYNLEDKFKTPTTSKIKKIDSN